ncbi:MAG TPA: GTP 3',8-cyclase MoaA [Planctomycetota bacterium]|nr:GTP 3',8-cyclase MoaA [Planctomycetota bacterium]
MFDRHGRELDHLRISVTDRCNMRCSYCMPDGDYAAAPREKLLSFEEIARVVGTLVNEYGVRHLRLTGGEPLVRKDLYKLVGQLARLPVADIAMTTNAVLLKGEARRLRDAGLNRLNISLDTLRQESLDQISPGTRLADILAGVDAAQTAGFTNIKFNAVLMRGINDDEILPLIRFAADRNGTMRFIELMPIGVMAGRHQQFLVPAAQIREVVQKEFEIREGQRPVGSPAMPYELTERATGRSLGFGIIASETEPFCMSCRRLRLTADGTFISCLFREQGADLRKWVRTEFASAAAAHAAFDALVEKSVALKPTTRLAMVKHAMVVVGG